MFFKISGAVLICMGGAMIGGYKALALSRRVLVISGFYEAITVFKSEINFMTATMEKAIQSAAKRDESGIFRNSLNTLFEKGAESSFEDAICSSDIESEEKEILLSFSKGLSGQDKESQIKNADIALLRFEALLKKATERKEKLFSLYCTMGVLGGAAGGILLL